MSAGLSHKLNILQQSPHDLDPAVASPSAVAEKAKVKWVASYYNVQATAADGQLIVWNTFRGTMSVFAPEQAAAVRALLNKKGFEAKPQGFVKYLSDRGFLVQAGTDEMRRFRVRFGQNHFRNDLLELILLASEDCNFRCSYCYEDFARGTMQPWVREAIKKLVEARGSGLRSLGVTWFGGEPLYGWQAIEDLAPFFVEFSQEMGIPYASSITTNGYLLTPEKAEKLLAWKVDNYQITLDGAPEDHDKSRPDRNGGGTFATIFNNLKSMRERPENYTVKLRVNFSPDNHPRLRTFLDLVEDELQGDRRFKLLFRAVGRLGGPNDAKLAVCAGDEGRRVQRELKAEAERRGLKLADDLHEVSGFGSNVCYAARPYNFIIGAHGQVMKCTIDLDKKDRNIVGQLNEDGGMKLDPDKFALWTEPAFEEDKQCQKCVVLPLCQGLYCPQERMDHHASPCTPLRREYKREMLGLLQRANSDGSREVAIGSR